MSSQVDRNILTVSLYHFGFLSNFYTFIFPLFGIILNVPYQVDCEAEDFPS